MAPPRYRFVTRWRLEATPDEIYDLLDKPEDFVRWWPSVWLKVEPIAPADAHGLGRVVRFTTKGRLPYTLHWTARTIESDPPRRLAIAATGDFNGTGRWTIEADGADTVVDYVWEVEATKPILRYGSFLFRPLFEANHRWAMARGEESLRRELSRRRVSGCADDLLVSARPAGPTSSAE